MGWRNLRLFFEWPKGSFTSVTFRVLLSAQAMNLDSYSVIPTVEPALASAEHNGGCPYLFKMAASIFVCCIAGPVRFVTWVRDNSMLRILCHPESCDLQPSPTPKDVMKSWRRVWSGRPPNQNGRCILEAESLHLNWTDGHRNAASRRKKFTCGCILLSTVLSQFHTDCHCSLCLRWS